jgi:N-acetylmuramoyl-L-alanine amidase
MSFKTLFSLFFAAFVLFCAEAWALDINSVRFGAHGEKERMVIELSSKTQFRAFVLQNPDRIIVDLKDFNWKVGNMARHQGTLVKDVRFGALGGGKGRVVIETSSPVIIKSAFGIDKGGGQPDRIVVDFAKTSAAMMKEASTQTMGNMITPNEPVQSLAKKDKAKPVEEDSAPANNTGKKRLVIIDPGHGGQDPGALGVNGAYEKTIVLAVGLELKRQLEKSGYRVEMTRSTDVFIPLHERVKFARKKGGDLFVSLHADSINRSNVTGASVYTLSDKASDKEAEKLAERENKSDLIAGIDLSHQEEDVADILIDLAARDTMNQSRYLAKTVITTLDDNGVGVLDRQYRSAGFAVLKAMDIPSILVEMGYLTNRQDVDRLSNSAYRAKVASALKLSIDKFFQKK